MADSEYQKRQGGNGTVFEVTPATAPKRIRVAAFGVISFLVGLGMIGTSNIGMFIFLGIGGLAIFVGLFKRVDLRPKAHKSKATFRVTPSTIETNGRTFNKEDISRLIIKNSTGLRDQYGHWVGGSELYATKLNKVANSLDLETGGKAYTLAGGMDATTAYGLMADVGDIIGSETWP